MRSNSINKAIEVVPLPADAAAPGDAYRKVGRNRDARRQYDLVEYVARAGLAAIVICLVAAGCTLAQARKPAKPDPPNDLGGEHVTLVTSDHVTLRGHLYGKGPTGVILAHMYPADQSDWTDFAQVLEAHGYQALTFDFRGFTESEGRVDVRFADRDLEAAYDFMRSRVSRIFLAGASMGSDASILVGSRRPVAGLICISTPISFRGMEVGEAIKHVEAPVLFIESEDDALVKGQAAILYRDTRSARTIKYYPGHAHGTALLHGPYQGEVQAQILKFIADHQ